MAEPTAEQLLEMSRKLAEQAEQAQRRQLGTRDLAEMTPQQVETARARGQFRDLLAGNDPHPAPGKDY